MEDLPLQLLAYALQCLIAAIFVQAGLSKMPGENQNHYASVIDAYGMTPKSLSPVLPRAIGSFELCVSVLILLAATSKIGLMCAAALFGLYLFAFAKQLMQGKADMDCGCAGPGAGVKISPLLLLRNATLIILCLLAVQSDVVPFGLEWLLVLPTAGIFVLIYFSSDQLIANQQKIQLLENT